MAQTLELTSSGLEGGPGVPPPLAPGEVPQIPLWLSIFVVVAVLNTLYDLITYFWNVFQNFRAFVKYKYKAERPEGRT